MLRKTNKATLSREIEKLGVAVDDIGSNTGSIINVMAIVQKTVIECKTFPDTAKSVFTRFLAGLKQSKRIDADFIVYLDCSIVNASRCKHGEK